MWKDIWVCQQEPETVLAVCHILAYEVLTPPGNQDTVLFRVCASPTPGIGCRPRLSPGKEEMKNLC